jgi:hypothetical protein
MMKAGLLDREFYRKARQHYQAFVEVPSSHALDATGRPHYQTDTRSAGDESSPDAKLLVGSRLMNYDHLPVLDIGFSAALLETGGQGRYSLSLNHAIAWRAYKRVMRSMVKAGLLDLTFYREALKNRQTFMPIQKQPNIRPSTPDETEASEIPEERVATCRGCGANVELSHEGFCATCGKEFSVSDKDGIFSESKA